MMQNLSVRDDADFDIELDNIGISVKEPDNILKEAKEANINLISSEKEKDITIESFMLRQSDRDIAVKRRLVPENYRDAKFDENKVRNNLITQHKKSNRIYRIFGFDKYMSVCNEILSSIRVNKLPRRSWIIGAPNGFGKTSFVNECIITMFKNNWITVPYISLSELAEIRVAEEQRLMRPFSDRLTQGIYNAEIDRYLTEQENYNYKHGIEPVDLIKKPNIITSSYSWSEYINAKCLFVHFSSILSKDLESNVLYQLLSIRGAKGLPTIVMVSTSLQPYLNDISLREIIWDEILDNNEDDNSFDRVAHISTYKKKNMDTGFNRNKSIEEDTGIVS